VALKSTNSLGEFMTRDTLSTHAFDQPRTTVLVVTVRKSAVSTPPRKLRPYELFIPENALRTHQNALIRGVSAGRKTDRTNGDYRYSNYVCSCGNIQVGDLCELIETSHANRPFCGRDSLDEVGTREREARAFRKRRRSHPRKRRRRSHPKERGNDLGRGFLVT
jgi:hypothetical protein